MKTNWKEVFTMVRESGFMEKHNNLINLAINEAQKASNVVAPTSEANLGGNQ